MADPARDDVPPRLHALLARVCVRAVEQVGVSDASVGVVTSEVGWLPGATTSASIRDLEDKTFTSGEGPVVDAVRNHAPMTVADLTSAESARRWPVWSGLALGVGVRGLTVLPVEAGAITAGALVLYSRSVWQPTDRQMTAAHSMSDAALLVLLNLATADDVGLDGSAAGSAVEHDLATLLRFEVHRAAGMVMDQAGLPIGAALARIRAYAFAQDRPLLDVANDVVARRLRFDGASEEE